MPVIHTPSASAFQGFKLSRPFQSNWRANARMREGEIERQFLALIPHLEKAQIKVLAYIIRHTAGFNKQSDAIAFSQFLGGIRDREGRVVDAGAGVSRASLAAALRWLERHRLILIARSGEGETRRRATNRYCLNVIEPLPPRADDRVIASAPTRATQSWRHGGSSTVEPTKYSPKENTNNVVKRRLKKPKRRQNRSCFAERFKEPERVDWLRDQACKVTGDDKPISQRAFARYAILLPDAVYLELLHQVRGSEGVRHRGKLFVFLCKLQLARPGRRLPALVQADAPAPNDSQPQVAPVRKSAAYARLRRQARALAERKSVDRLLGLGASASPGSGAARQTAIPSSIAPHRAG